MTHLETIAAVYVGLQALRLILNVHYDFRERAFKARGLSTLEQAVNGLQDKPE